DLLWGRTGLRAFPATPGSAPPGSGAHQGRCVEQFTTNVPGLPGTCTAAHLAALAWATLTSVNWAPMNSAMDMAASTPRDAVLIMFFSPGSGPTKSWAGAYPSARV